MSEVMKQPAVMGTPEISLQGAGLSSYLPAAIAFTGAGALTLLRIKVGPEHFSTDGALMMLALAAYLVAATFYLLNLYAPSRLFERVGLACATVGVLMNLASWLTRWVAYREHDVSIWMQQGKPAAEWPWVFRNIPFANLYDLSLAFAFGAGFATLLIAHRKNFRFLGAVSLPLAALILILARFIGDDILGLQPVLDSYWRPIHVGIASLTYGIALVCFATAVVYLLKDGVKVEAMAFWSSVFAIAIISTIGGPLGTFPILTTGTYAAATFLPPHMPVPLRADIPFVGPLLIIAGLLLLGVVVLFGTYAFSDEQKAPNVKSYQRWGWYLIKAALVAQAEAKRQQAQGLQREAELDATQIAQAKADAERVRIEAMAAAEAEAVVEALRAHVLGREVCPQWLSRPLRLVDQRRQHQACQPLAPLRGQDHQVDHAAFVVGPPDQQPAHGAAGGHDHAVLDPRIAGRVSSLPSSVLVPEQGFREGRVRGWPAGQEGLPEQLGVVRPGHPESEGEGSGHDGSQGYTGWPFAGTQP